MSSIQNIVNKYHNRLKAMKNASSDQSEYYFYCQTCVISIIMFFFSNFIKTQ